MSMKKLAVAVIVLVALSAGILPAQPFQGPKITASELKFDFGKVVQGSEVSHVFEVRNAGTEPLVIERVVPS